VRGDSGGRSDVRRGRSGRAATRLLLTGDGARCGMPSTNGAEARAGVARAARGGGGSGWWYTGICDSASEEPICRAGAGLRDLVACDTVRTRPSRWVKPGTSTSARAASARARRRCDSLTACFSTSIRSSISE
jgi:hypothetical protein